jgi:hypothetical protein
VTVPTFTVVLEVVWKRAVVGSTEDVIEARDAADAEAKAIKAWRALRPGRSFRPLLTTQHT